MNNSNNTTVTLEKNFNAISKTELINLTWLSEYLPSNINFFQIDSFSKTFKGAGHYEITIYVTEIDINTKDSQGASSYSVTTTNMSDLDLIGDDSMSTSTPDEDYTEEEENEASAMDVLIKEILTYNFS